jgi:outer membrane murein-binding lipoprotein Lpp
MQSNRRRPVCLKLFLAISISTCWSSVAWSQSESPRSADETIDVKSLAASVRQLQAQVQTLNEEMDQVRLAAQRAQHETEALRTQLNRANSALALATDKAHDPSNSTSSLRTAISTPSLPTTAASQQVGVSIEQQISDLRDDEHLLNDKVVEQSQTKVESGSKYRVRLSGIVLLNTAITRGAVDNLDFPEIATPATTSGTSGAFSGSLRQSQIGIEAFGPDIAGARTSANLKFDFAGGFPDIPNGSTLGILRLRTGTIRFDWENTSIVAGQDSLFISPLTPTSLASLAIPALSYSGNLWAWTPQIRVEHRVHLSSNSSLLLEAGILDSLTGDTPPTQQNRAPTVGEQSGQPAYASRIAWTGKVFGRDLTLGSGGYYGRQNWGFGRNLDGWAATVDATLPLGSLFELSGEAYRGRAVAGLNGGIGQSILLSGPIANPDTIVQGLDSVGGWFQLKIKPKTNFEVNLAYGQDNPFASELRAFPASGGFYGGSLSRNLSPFANFIYRVRSDVLVSVEYRRLQTYTLDSNANSANQITLSLGYLF